MTDLYNDCRVLLPGVWICVQSKGCIYRSRTVNSKNLRMEKSMEAQGKRHLELGTVLDGRYIIEEILGEGGFGVTYRAENQRVGISVAM